MTYRSSYRGDPYWLTAKYSGQCSGKGCSDRINRGDPIFYYPRFKRAYVGPCADRAAADFANMVEVEDMLGGYR